MACAKFCRDQEFALKQLNVLSQRETRISLFIKVSVLCCFVYWVYYEVQVLWFPGHQISWVSE